MQNYAAENEDAESPCTTIRFGLQLRNWTFIFPHSGKPYGRINHETAQLR